MQRRPRASGQHLKSQKRVPLSRLLLVLGLLMIAVLSFFGGRLTTERDVGVTEAEDSPDSAVSSPELEPITTSTLLVAQAAEPGTTTTTLSAEEGAIAPSPSEEVIGDLGLPQAMSVPNCDGSFVVFVGAVITPGEYEQGVSRLLDINPNSHYLRTDVACSSLRAATEKGDPIYAVYLGPFRTLEEACQARQGAPSGSYVKPLVNSLQPEPVSDCP